MSAKSVVPVREKIAFGLGDFAINIAYTAIGFYFVFFLVNVAGLPTAIAGIVFLIARAWDAIMNFVAGNVSDRTTTRFGKRRPFILASAIPMGVLFALLWIAPGRSTTFLFAYYVVIAVIYNTAFSFAMTPYNALMPELSQDYDERTSISGYRMALAIVGNLVAAAGGSVIVDTLYGGAANYRHSYPVMGAVFGGIMIVSLLITFFGTHERVPQRPGAPMGFIATLRSVLSLREFRIVLGMFIFNMVGLDLIQMLFIFYLKYAVRVKESLTFLLMGIPLVTAICAVPLWVWISGKLGKRGAYMTAAVYFAAALVVAIFVPAGAMIFVIVLAVMAGIGFSAASVIPFSIIPDVIEIDELTSGARREGIFYGTSMLLYKVCSGLVIALATAALGWFGYVEGPWSAEPGSAILAIRLFFGIGPGVLFLLSALCVKILPITRERFDEIKKIIEKREGRVEA
ncbi:MAG: glycoside-pentoside-hexuronide (GPH):cation symporter [Anaerolineales bacterium]|jgi:GPH family glycoside/pentoside/hexuronide:cation symporter